MSIILFSILSTCLIFAIGGLFSVFVNKTFNNLK